MRRILTIDGGGVKGAFPASFLSSLEEDLGKSVADHFDLIVGTSTGGLIALALGLRISPEKIRDFYRDEGPKIFAQSRFSSLKRWVTSKYDSGPLKESLTKVFGQSLLGESKSRLAIPSFNIEAGEVYVFKTAHHERFKRDYRESVVDVALATTAAPAFLPTFRLRGEVPLVDGGVWANNPIALAVVESITVLNWPPEDTRVLSIGCTEVPYQAGKARTSPVGILGWLKVHDLLFQAQSAGGSGMAQLLLGEGQSIHRVSPVCPPGRYALDSVKGIQELLGLGKSESRKQLPKLSEVFFGEPAEVFQPIYSPS